MIQGGDPKGDGTGGAEETIKGEFSKNGVENPLSHKRGVISMARSQMPDSAKERKRRLRESFPKMAWRILFLINVVLFLWHALRCRTVLVPSFLLYIRSQMPDSASSQFFIVHEDSTYLDGEYAAFGYVTEGMDVVDKICEEVTGQDQNGMLPNENQPVIESITVKE